MGRYFTVSIWFLIAWLAFGAWRLRRKGARPGPAAGAMMSQLMDDQRRAAIEIVLEERAAAHDPEDRDGNLPDLAGQTLSIRQLSAPESPLLIEFVAPTSLLRETDRPSALPIIGNGPPGTFVLFPDGFRVSLPTDQIVFADDAGGRARVGFGGMQFIGPGDSGERDERCLVFRRVRELVTDDQLSPDRSHTMRLDPAWVAAILVDGRRVWPDGHKSG